MLCGFSLELSQQIYMIKTKRRAELYLKFPPIFLPKRTWMNSLPAEIKNVFGDNYVQQLQQEIKDMM